MPFKPGNRLGKGRKPGSSNELTKETKHFFVLFLHDNKEKLNEWLEKVASKDPYKACDILLRAAEFSLPKMQRLDADIRADITTIKVLEPLELTLQEWKTN